MLCKTILEYKNPVNFVNPEFNRINLKDTASTEDEVFTLTLKGVAEARHEPSDCTHG
jgi:hypothetical protein